MEEKVYRALVVDDEEIFRAGMNHLIETRCPRWQVAAQAATAREAMDALSHIEVDLVITDIKMPGLSGLDLIEHLRNEKPDMEIMIISGYGDFQFAKQAMRHHVFYYLLKPLNMDEFASVMDDIAKNLDTRGMNQNNLETEYYNSVINSILNNDIAAQDHLKSFFPQIMKSYTLMVIDMDLRGASLPGEMADDLSFLTHMRNALKRLCASLGCECLVFFRNKALWGIVIGSGGVPNADAFWPVVQDALLREFSIRSYAGSVRVRSIEENFSDCFSSAYRAAKMHIYNPLQSYHAAENLGPSARFEVKEETMQKLHTAITSCQEAESRRQLEAIFALIREARPDIFLLSHFFRKFSYELMHLMENSQMLDQETIRYFDSLQNMQAFYALDEIRQTAEEFVLYALSLFQKRMEGRYSRIVESTIRYIDANYTQDLSIGQLADRVSINQNYLSGLFKAETDMTVLEYLTYIRMEKAKSLLLQDHYRLADIAQATGYRDVKYFIRAFKKNIGVTPSEFRHYNR